MSAITAAAVKELREITGVAMMDCKKALVECNGDLEEAKEFLRKKGQAKALKKSSRETREGAVEIRVDENHRSGAIIKLACETDFVARNESFKALLQTLGGQVLSQGSDALMEQQLVDGGGTTQDLIPNVLRTWAHQAAGGNGNNTQRKLPLDPLLPASR
jgi:elongation factor Ts